MRRRWAGCIAVLTDCRAISVNKGILELLILLKVVKVSHFYDVSEKGIIIFTFKRKYSSK